MKERNRQSVFPKGKTDCLSVFVKIFFFQVPHHSGVKFLAVFLSVFLNEMKTGSEILFPDGSVDLFTLFISIDMFHNSGSDIIIFLHNGFSLICGQKISITIVPETVQLITVIRFSESRTGCCGDITELPFETTVDLLLSRRR